ncbi:hypothetical protein [Bradyrhizobium quebecense]|uniref:Uncharacterized protein n=2 Tax=Bradyrhizobium quebecense TaxID=2748629 RepID=A0ACD3V9P3_9BRAD|nr:hypothetical protein [Bradyrhizobium quebecense]UGY03140.1 hypothetical protein J4P68_0039860 [Bradyrhizobium quebecense]
MADQVVTELVIDANTQGASDYERAMDSAAGAAQRGTDAATGFNVGLVALGAGAIAAAATVNKALDYIVSFNKSLADLSSLADRVGLSLKDLQGIQFGGQIAGLTESQINAGLEKSAQLLNDAQRNANSLSKEFDANGISLRNANGQLISQNQLLQIAADLVSRARSPQDATAIAQMLGFTKEWVPLLQQGAGAMADLGNQAQAAGAVIDDETVKRASDFDAEWRKSSVQWSLYMKAAFADLLPFLDDLIERAAKFIKSIDRDAIEKAANEQLDALSGAVGGPGTNQTVGIRIGITPETERALADFKNASVFSLDFWESAGRILSSSVERIRPEDIKWYAGTGSSITDTSNAQSEFAWQGQAASLKSMQAGLAGLQFGRPSNVAARGDAAADPVDRAINSLRKHTETQEADTRAVGLGDAALASFRATAAETSAVQANNGKETAAQAAQFAALRDRAAAAADALARAKVSSQIDFNSKTAFLSSDDVAIASQLKGIYGNDVPAALDSTYAAAIRTNNAFKGISSSIEGDLVNGLTDITTGAKSAGQGFTDMSNAIVKAIEQMIIKITIVEPLMRSLQSAAGGLGLFSLGGSAGGGGASSTGAAGVGGIGGLYHTGGIIGSEPTSMRYIHRAYFDDAPRFHTGGIAGNEIPIIAQRGEGVFTPGQMAALGGGGGRSPQVTINNYTDGTPAIEHAPNGDITVTLRKMVDGAVGDSLSTGTGRRVLGDQYGVKPFTGQ